MAHYVNSQKSSKIGGSVTNKVAGTTSLRKVMTDKNINSQIDSDIGGDVTNTFVGAPNTRCHEVGLSTRLWKAIPGINAAMQIYEKLLHLFGH
jgi:hypothetical protein